jgi:hypothetical protein
MVYGLCTLLLLTIAHGVCGKHYCWPCAELHGVVGKWTNAASAAPDQYNFYLTYLNNTQETKNPINNSEARKKSSKFHPPGWSTGFLDPETRTVLSEPRPGREHAYSKKFVGSINFKNHDFRSQNLEFKKANFVVSSS